MLKKLSITFSFFFLVYYMIFFYISFVLKIHVSIYTDWNSVDLCIYGICMNILHCYDTLRCVTHVLKISINEVFRFFKRKKDQYTCCIKGTQPCNGVSSTVTRRTTRLTGFVTVVTVVTQIIFYKGIECTKWKQVSNLNWFTKYAFCRWYWPVTWLSVRICQWRCSTFSALDLVCEATC